MGARSTVCSRPRPSTGSTAPTPARPIPLIPRGTVLTGEQRSRGIELGLERSVSSRWLMSAGYACRRPRSPDDHGAAPAGREVPLVPRHSFSLWNRYDVTKRLALGLGVIARSKSYASISNAVKLPGYARVDAALYYKLPRGIEAQVNVENIARRRLFPDRQQRQQYRARARRGRSRRQSATASSAASSSARALIRLRSWTNSARSSRLRSSFGNPEQEARVNGDPAFAAIGKRHRRAAHACRSSRPCRAASAPRSRRARPSPADGSARAHGRSTSGRPSISPASGLLWMRLLPRCTNLKCLTALVT